MCDDVHEICAKPFLKGIFEGTLLMTLFHY